MSNKVKCTCGWSWNKSDSSKKDMYICHECGRDNSNNMKNGGWLDSYDKAQDGKDVTPSQDETSFAKDYMSSPAYYDMLKKSSEKSGEDMNMLSAMRNINLKNTSVVFPEKNTSSTPGATAESNSDTGEINVYPEAVNSPFLKGIIQHEISHSVDRPIYPGGERVIPKSDIDLISKYSNIDKNFLFTSPEFKDAKYDALRNNYRYISEPTETRARLNDIRYNAKSSKLYDPFTEKVTPEILKKIKNSKTTDAFDDLNSIYNDDQIIDLLNSVSQNKQFQKESFVAKNGGWLDSYADGGTMQEHQENYNDYKVSAPEGFKGTGYSNVGRNYSPAWGGQFQEGGEIPNAQKGKKVKYLESENDPGYKAYQDSVSLYNHTLSRFKEPWASDKKFKKTVNSNKNSKEYKEALKKYYDEDVKKSNIKPTSIIFSDRKKDTYIPVFKKPQQEVIVKPTTTKQTTKPNDRSKKRKPTEKEIKEWSEPGFKLNSVTDYIDPKTKKVTQSWYGDLTRNEQAIQNNIQPEGIQNDFNIEAPIPVIRPQAIMPKSFDVTSQRQTMSGPSDYYNYNQQGLSVEQAAEVMRAAEAFNQSIQDKYGNNKNPKAQERYNQLMQNVEVTPNYQMGGKLKSNIPVIEDAGGYNEDGYWVPDWEAMTAQAKKLGAKRVKTKHGSLIVFDNNWEVIDVDDNPDAMQMGGNVYPVNYVPQAQDGYRMGTYFDEDAREREPNMMEETYDDYRTAMEGMMKSKMATQASLGNKGAQRMMSYMPPEYTFTGEERFSDGNLAEGAGSYGTHYMSNHDNYVYPNLQDDGEGTLNFISNASSSDREAMRFESPSEAQYFAEHYKDVAPMSNTYKGLQEYAMGGSIPGSVGFTYARTKGIPSEGPYAKKTLPSAQNGQEMRYYQNGLDWKPKGMKDGGWLDGYEKAQEGEKIKIKDERKYAKAVYDNIQPISFKEKRGTELLIKETENAKKDKQELQTTGTIKYPRSIHYKRLAPKQSDLKTQTKSNEELEGQLGLERPLVYLANPEKLLGDIGVPGMETSELDRQAVMANRFNPNQSRLDRFANNVKIGAGYVPEATVNTAMAATFMPEGSGALGLVNEALNPLAGLSTSIAPELRQGLVTQGFSNPLEIVDKVVPRPPTPGTLFGMEDSWNNYSPLNLIPGYGKKLSAKSSHPNFVGFRKFGNSIQDVIESQSLRPKGTGMGSKQIMGEGNWAEPGKVNENYSGVFEATMNPQIQSSNIKLEKWNKRNGIVGTTQEGDVAIPLTDTGLSFNRRLPFSNRYIPIDKQKLIDNEFQLATQLPYLQSLIEKYGLWAGGAGAAGYFTGGSEGAKENINTINDYTINPIIDQVKRQMENSPLNKKKDGGVIKDDRGQWDHPGEITEIDSPYITMQGVPYPVLGISDTGDTQMMYPEEEYEFDGEKVTEYPMARNGRRQEQKGLVNLDQLTNWSNYNTKQKGGWLDNL